MEQRQPQTLQQKQSQQQMNARDKLTELNLLDKFLFDEVMEDTGTYETMIGILLENEVRLLEKPETEKELRVSSQLRAIRLDVVSMDDKKKLYYTEMQKKNTGNLKKRSRYYQAQMDVSLLEPGTKDFNLLNDSCMILVAPFDLFGKGLYRYTFEGTCRECPELRLEDGATRVFINTRGTNREAFSQEFLDLMEYLSSSTRATAEKSASESIRRIHCRVEQVRQLEKAGVKYMQRWEELAEARDEGVNMGEAKGRELALISMVCRKLEKGKSVERIAEELEEETAVIRRICDAAEDCAPAYDEAAVYARLHEKDEVELSWTTIL